VKFHTIYRSSPGENRKSRPDFYTKTGALKSFLGAAAAGPDGERVFVNDGSMPEDRAELMRQSGARVIELGGVGNARSYRACVALVDSSAWDDGDIVYFAEDDYLYLPEAFVALAAAFGRCTDAEYLTLYDHPEYYSRRHHARHARKDSTRFSVGDVEWRAVRSTCLTYGARVGAIRRDSWVHHLASRESPPGDHAIWSTVVGSGSEFAIPRILRHSPKPDLRSVLAGNLKPRRRVEKSRLFAARPGLATHLESEHLSPGRNWAEVAAGRA
jgi:hypothetical protein